MVKVWNMWQVQSPRRETTGEGEVSVAVEDPGLKGSCKEVEAWHHEEIL